MLSWGNVFNFQGGVVCVLHFGFEGQVHQRLLLALDYDLPFAVYWKYWSWEVVGRDQEDVEGVFLGWKVDEGERLVQGSVGWGFHLQLVLQGFWHCIDDNFVFSDISAVLVSEIDGKRSLLDGWFQVNFKLQFLFIFFALLFVIFDHYFIRFQSDWTVGGAKFGSESLVLWQLRVVFEVVDGWQGLFKIFGRLTFLKSLG